MEAKVEHRNWINIKGYIILINSIKKQLTEIKLTMLYGGVYRAC
jgi:hypothetical protein